MFYAMFFVENFFYYIWIRIGCVSALCKRACMALDFHYLYDIKEPG